MSPNEKLLLQIERAFDADYKNYSEWEKEFLRNICELIKDPRKSPSPKQKNMAWQLTKKHA